MGWLYILIRVYPFWALPVGTGLVTAAFKNKNASPLKRWIVIFLGITMIVTSVLFLMFQGHQRAVPWMYEILNSQ